MMVRRYDIMVDLDKHRENTSLYMTIRIWLGLKDLSLCMIGSIHGKDRGDILSNHSEGGSFT